jgi:quinol monooxygenase YgiN
MLVVTRYRVAATDVEAFRDDAAAALQALCARPGCLTGTVGRAADEADLWTLTTTWRSVGDYRRALSSYEVKVHAVPLMYRAIDEPSAYEPLLRWTPAEGMVEVEPARAPDADSAGPAGHT